MLGIPPPVCVCCYRAEICRVLRTLQLEGTYEHHQTAVILLLSPGQGRQVGQVNNSTIIDFHILQRQGHINH